MDVAVISERLGELLDDCEVKAAAFTTYTFDPEFFELEVVPLLLPGNIPFSSDSRVKQFQVREALRESGIDLEVFFDLTVFRREGSVSPAMEYRFQGIHRGNNAFHAKLAFILVYDRHYERDCLLVAAGSNNLSRSGWWDNIECQHWETVWPYGTPRKFLDQLIDDVEWLCGQRHLGSDLNGSAMDQIANYLRSCAARTDAEEVSYYGLNDASKRGAFPGFISRSVRRRLRYENWTLEIISPFFAEDPQNVEHDFFLDLGVQAIHLLLPKDQEGRALCPQAYFDHINASEGIHWADWAEPATRDLGVQGQFYRRLHAKVYHFYNGRQSWAFVGSVNFSHKAMFENIEAGFLTKLETRGPLLRPIKRLGSIEHFVDPTEVAPGLLIPAEDEETPRVFLAYDWFDRQLTGVTESHQSYTISILTPEGNPAVADWPITGTPRQFEGETGALEQLLRNGSLVKVGGFHTRSGESFPAHTVLLQQTGWTHKPLALPDLSPAEILAIYAGLAQELRQVPLVKKLIHELVVAGAGGEMTTSTDDLVVEQFFCEYAEIFHAFRRLRIRLMEALDADNQPIVDYYLTGAGMDSLPTLIEHATREATPVSAVTGYLLCLCAREIYQQPEFSRVRHVKSNLRAMARHIRDFKVPGRITLEDNSTARRKAFFTWFEAQFFKAYRVKEVEA